MEGEVIGIRFNTVSFTWSLPQAKLHSLVTGLHDLLAGTSNHSLRELQSILGKLNNVSQLCPALKTLTSEAKFMMREHIHTLMKEDGSITQELRDSHIFRPSPEVSQDLMMVADTYDNPLPIADPDQRAPLCSVSIYPDASCHIAGSTSPCLGVLFPAHDLQQAAAFNFPFPTDFLLQSNGTGLVADTTTAGEFLGILIPMITNPVSLTKYFFELLLKSHLFITGAWGKASTSSLTTSQWCSASRRGGPTTSWPTPSSEPPTWWPEL